MITWIFLSSVSFSSMVSATRGGPHRNVLHYTSGTTYFGPPVATLSPDETSFYVYYMTAEQDGSEECPCVLKTLTSKDSVHWEEKGGIFALPPPGASYGAAAVYPNPQYAKYKDLNDTKYDVLVEQVADGGRRSTISLGSDDGLTAHDVTIEGKKKWHIRAVTSVDPFLVEGRGGAQYRILAYLKNNLCDKIYFILDDDNAGEQTLNYWLSPISDTTQSCNNLAFGKLDTSNYIIAMTVGDSTQTPFRTQFWIASIDFDEKHPEILVTEVEKGAVNYIDDGTDAAYFRLGRLGRELKAIGYVANPAFPYPQGMVKDATLARTLTYKHGLRQTFPNLRPFASYVRPHLDADYNLRSGFCPLQIPLGGLAIDSGWVFTLHFDEKTEKSGWKVHFRTGNRDADNAQYISLSYFRKHLNLDRSRTGYIAPQVSKSKEFTQRRTGPVEVVLDRAVIEVYVNSKSGHTTVMTMAYWTDKPITHLCFSLKGNPTKLLKNSFFYQVPSIWDPRAPTTHPGEDSGCPAAIPLYAGGFPTWLMAIFFLLLLLDR